MGSCCWYPARALGSQLACGASFLERKGSQRPVTPGLCKASIVFDSRDSHGSHTSKVDSCAISGATPLLRRTWKWRGGPYETTILYMGASMSFHVLLWAEPSPESAWKASSSKQQGTMPLSLKAAHKTAQIAQNYGPPPQMSQSSPTRGGHRLSSRQETGDAASRAVRHSLHEQPPQISKCFGSDVRVT